MPAQKRLIVINGTAKPWQAAANERIEAGENFVLIVQNTPHELGTLKEFLGGTELPRQCADPREWQKQGRYLSIEDEANFHKALASHHSIFYVELIKTGRIKPCLLYSESIGVISIHPTLAQAKNAWDARMENDSTRGEVSMIDVYQWENGKWVEQPVAEEGEVY
ncbi:MAG TPA: hypothetical protein VGK40_02595 [Verrucomicrobiae bacterium]|jgi:hypothetical protein